MESVIKILPELINTTGLAPALLLFVSIVLIFYCRLLIKNNTTLHQDVSKKLLESERREEDCRQQYQEIMEELRQIKNKNDELVSLNRDYERQLKESQKAQQAIMNTFTKTVEQFMEKYE